MALVMHLVYSIPLRSTPSLILGALQQCSSCWLLEIETRGFSQAEKEKTACKAEQIHKMTTIFTQNDNLGPF